MSPDSPLAVPLAAPLTTRLPALPCLELQQASHRYGPRGGGVRQAQLALLPGCVHVLVGRSGCGKTTLLKLAAGLLPAHQGQVRVQGQAVLGPQPGVSLVLQTPTLLPWLSVRANVLLPLSLQRGPQASGQARADALLEQMGLGALAQERPARLSGGQQSRVALARALVTEPALLLLDEPFAALDAMTREELQQTLSALCEVRRTAMLFVTHDLAEAVFLADQVSVMHAGQLGTSLSIDLPRPRQPSLRESSAFARYCAQLRHQLQQAEAGAEVVNHPSGAS